jgi:hypothetical protein
MLKLIKYGIYIVALFLALLIGAKYSAPIKNFTGIGNVRDEIKIDIPQKSEIKPDKIELEDKLQEYEVPIIQDENKDNEYDEICCPEIEDVKNNNQLETIITPPAPIIPQINKNIKKEEKDRTKAVKTKIEELITQEEVNTIININTNNNQYVKPIKVEEESLEQSINIEDMQQIPDDITPNELLYPVEMEQTIQ